MDLRDATTADVPAISALYNATVLTTTVAWTEERESVTTRQSWLEDHQEAGHPVLVAEVDGHVVGFAAYDDFRNTTKWRRSTRAPASGACSCRLCCAGP
jgi:L-amino acid N-acyltransferase YncA